MGAGNEARGGGGGGGGRGAGEGERERSREIETLNRNLAIVRTLAGTTPQCLPVQTLPGCEDIPMIRSRTGNYLNLKIGDEMLVVKARMQYTT